MRGARISLSAPALALGVALGAALGATGPARAQSIVSLAADPDQGDTGDRFVLHATLRLPRDCAWTTSARVDFGVQPELGPGPGWGVELEAVPQTDDCTPGTLTLDTTTDLGLLPVAAGPGIARLRFDGAVADAAPFDLQVDAGPAPGWAGPAADAALQIFVQSDGLTAIDGLLAISDTLHREIVVFDPLQEIVIEFFGSPGSGDIRALTTDGLQFWAATLDATGPRLYRLGRHGGIVESFPSPTVSTPQALEGLAWRAGVLYGAYPSPPLLFAVNATTHQILWQRSLPVRMTGLVSVPEGLIGIDGVGGFHLIDPTPSGGSQLIADPVDTGLPTQADHSDVAWDGLGLYVFDQNQSTVHHVRTYALWWATDLTLRAYAPPFLGPVDVIRGDLDAVHFTAGNVDLGPTLCLMADSPGGGVVDDAGGPPPLGSGYFYLARFRGAGGFEVSWGRSSIGFRRSESAPACP